MSVPVGYKATEVGVIPEDWEAKPLSSLKPFITSGSRGWAKYYAETGDAFVRITNLSRQNIYPDLTDLRRVKLPEGENEGTRTGLRNGDVLVSITADIGIIGFVDDRVPKPAYINQHIATVRVDQTEANSKFLSYFLATEGSQRRVRATTDAGAKAGMSLTGVGNLLAAFPPTVTEQTAIAEALSDVDEAIAAQEAVIAKKRDLKTATMQALLSGTRRLSGFSGEWDSVTMDYVGRFSKGKGLAKHELSSVGSVPAIPYTAIYTDFDGIIQQSQIKNFTCRKKGRAIISSPHLLFAGSSNMLENVGKAVAYMGSEEVAIGGDVLIYETAQHVGFIAYLLNTDRHRERIVALSQGSTIRHVYPSTFDDYRLLLPDLCEQHAIVEAISDQVEDVHAENSKLAKLRDLRTGMMQQLLTGKIRLV